MFGPINQPGEIYHFEECSEICGRIRGRNSGTTVRRFHRGQAGLGEHPAERRRVE